MRTRNKIIIGIFVACLAVAVGIWMEVRTGRQMRAAVEQALEQNRNYVPFTSDTIYLGVDSSDAVTLRDAVAYYRHPLRRFLSRHSSFFTLNSSLIKSLYALGCVYRDLHEAPIAIITWEEAVAAADTTADDCDYHTLCATYSQLSSAYDEKLLLSKEISCLHSSSFYSLLEGDTLYAIDIMRRIGSCYYLLHKYDSAEYYYCKSQALYHTYNYHQKGLLASTPLISLYIEQGRLKEAKSLMDKYEADFDEFDERHELPPKRRQYFCYKGKYYEQLGLLDSADYYYRKAMRPNMSYSSQDPIYAGLLRVFQQTGQADSIAKYAQLYCAANDSSIAITDRELTAQAAANYNYTRSQTEAIQQKERASRLVIALTILGALLIVVSVITIMVIRFYRERKRRQNIEIARLKNDLKTALSEYTSQTQALNQMESMHKTSMELLIQDINRLKVEKEDNNQRLEQSQKALEEMSAAYAESSLTLSEVIERNKQRIEFLEHQICIKEREVITIDFEDSKAVNHIRGMVHTHRKMLKSDLRILIETGHLYFPILMEDLSSHKDITPRAIQVCLLLLICDRVEDIANLLGVSASRVTNLKGDISLALFGKRDSRSLLQRLAEHYGTPIP